MLFSCVVIFWFIRFIPYFFLGFGLAEKFPYHLQFYWIFYRWLVNSKLEALWSEIGDSIRKLYHNQRPVLYPSWSLYIWGMCDFYLKSLNSFWGDQITKMINQKLLVSWKRIQMWLKRLIPRSFFLSFRTQSQFFYK